MPAPQGRYWLLTIPENEFTPHLPDTVSYIRGQLEIGATTGYRHWQILACFDKKCSLRPVTLLFGPFHAELSRSAAATEYVWKDDTSVADTRFEYGTLPFRRNLAVDWIRVWQAAIAGDLDSIPEQIRISHYRSIRTIRSDHSRPIAMVRTCHVFWGPTGTGKSRRAWDESGMDAFPKDPRTKWWDGYSNHKHVVIDEFRGAIDVAHLLRWLDRYPVLVEIKGGTVPLVTQTIWITSNVNPREWYPEIDPLTLAALIRRLNITEFCSL